MNTQSGSTATFIMPPRSANRRSARTFRSEEPESDSPLPKLQKPNLPKLKGTPSSRRQYTYGSGEEPLPSRAGHRLRQDEALDLGNAVGSLLQRQEEEFQPPVTTRMAPPPVPVRSQEEDELAEAQIDITPGRSTSEYLLLRRDADYENLLSLGNRQGPRIQGDGSQKLNDALSRGQRSGHAQPPPDDLSIRSYGTESDIYGDATVASSPRTTPVPEKQQSGPQQKRGSNLRPVAREPTPSEASDELANSPPQSQPQSPAPVPRRSLRKPLHEERAVGSLTQTAPRLEPRRLKPITDETRPQRFASDHSERDDEIQNHIRYEDDEDIRSQQAISPWRQSWVRVKNFSPFRSRHDQVEEATEEESEDEGSVIHNEPPREPRQWPKALQPSTYFNGAVWLVDLVLDFILATLSSIRDAGRIGIAYLGRVNPLLAFFVVSLLASGLLFALYGQGSDFELTTPSWNLSDKFERAWEHLPTFSLPFGGNQDKGLFGLDEDEIHELTDYIRRYDDVIKDLKKTGKLHDDALQKLRNELPSYVRLEKKDGKLVIPQEFWHARRSKEDEDFLTDKVKSEGLGIEHRLRENMASDWDKWYRDNVKEAEKAQNGATHDKTSIFVTKDEFLRHVNNELAVHKREIQAELSSLRPSFEAYVRDAIQTAENSKLLGLSKEKATTFVNGLIRQSLTNLNIEALAKGKIHSHWDLKLKNEINYFNLNMGATVNPKFSSHVYNPYNRKVISGQDYVAGSRGMLVRPHLAALDGWSEEGDCWCAARDVDPRGQPHGAKLAVQMSHLVVPQQIVIEHILPGATTAPDARPKNIEIYAEYVDPALREAVRDFSSANVAPDPARNIDPNFPAEYEPKGNTVPANFVKIGQFTYEGAELHDGVHVHELSRELTTLRAATDQIIIRATSNYGAENHTCFYRVRMFGKTLQELEPYLATGGEV